MDKPHKNLDAWKLAMELVSRIYRITNAFPAEERFGLSQQLRRASVSIPSNIAEGASRNGDKEFHQFINIARGSLSEVDTQLDIAVRLGYLIPDVRHDTDNLMIRIDKTLYKLQQSLRNRI